MSSARERILAKLKKADAYPMREPEIEHYYEMMSPRWENEVDRLRFWAKTMRAVKGEIYWVRAKDWTTTFQEIVAKKALNTILLPLTTKHGKLAQKALKGSSVEIKAFNQKIEDWKNLFSTI